MSNNTPNDQKYTFSELLAQYDKILVPMIQRDYAQGRSDKKATDVRSNLLNDIFSGNKVHFDLVFGSKEERSIDGKKMNCFIPVDGQQRLTTLFLLYLYGQKAGKTNTKLDLSKFSYDTRRAASDFCKSITSEEWAVPNDKNVSDVIKDSSWFMNYWEKDTTVGGMLNMLDAIHGKCKEITVYPNLDNVTFFLFDLESNGLNENLYLKMNSRGKPLTAFENLKAKIEKVLPDTNKIETKWFPENNDAPKNSFKEKWKFFMDRDWTETFWDSANPEKYDVSITKFIVRFLAGYWAAYGTDEEQMANDLKSLNSKDSYADFIPFGPIKKVLDLENAFPKLAYALTTAPQIAPYWTNDAIKISDKSEYKFLAVIFTYVLFEADKDAMRFAWNMAENYVTEYDTFVTYCKRAGEISNFKRDKNCTFYQTLSSIEFIGNTSDQMKEEIAKAQQILNGKSCTDGKTWKEIISESEKYAFFKGAIRFLFQNDKGELDLDESKTWNTENFDTKLKNAKEYFDADGVKGEYRKNAILLRTFISKYNEWGDFWGVEYDNEATTWKKLLTSRFKSAHSILINTVDINNDFSTFKASLKEYDVGYEDLQNAVQQDLVKTLILVEASNLHPKLNWRNNTYCLFPSYAKADRGKFVIANKRNAILSDLMREEKIVCEQKIENCNFFWGWDIYFKYKHNNKDYYFLWWRNPNKTQCDVYLMEDEWADKVKRPDYKEGKHDKDNFYCFEVTSEMEENTTLFTEELKRLIADEASNKK